MDNEGWRRRMEVGNGWRGDSEERGEEVNGGDRVEEGWRRGKERR